MPSFQSILNSPISWDLAPSLPLYRWGNQLLTIQLQGLLKRYWLVSYKTQHPGNQEMNGQWAVIRKPNFLIYSIRSSDLIHSWEEFPLLACVPIHFSNAWLFTTLWTVAHQALLSVGFSRHEYWSGLPCPPPGDLPDPGTEPESLMSPAGSLPLVPCGNRMKTFDHPSLQEGNQLFCC